MRANNNVLPSTMAALLVGVVTGWAVLSAPPAEANEILVELEDIHVDEILTIGFELPKDVTVEVEAVGLRGSSERDLSAYAWLLDHDTREPIWIMEKRQRERSKTSGDQVIAAETLRLEAGRYELYMCALSHWGFGAWNGDDINDLGDVIRRFTGAFSGRSNREFERELRDCRVSLVSDEITRHEVETFEVTGAIPGALVQLHGLGDDEFVKQGFELTEAGHLRVYAVVEIPDKTAVDRAWIVNAETHERVWETTRRNTDYAGGGSKNRMADEELKLDAGKYVLYYSSDDSHSWESFNTRPPNDPMNWGVSLLPGSGFRRGSFKLYDVPERGDALIELTRARDDDYLEQAFELKREANLYIRALGEYSDWGDEFVDFGGIQDAASGDQVWEMTGRNTCHAGGAEKNRCFEGMVKLPAGRYIAYYTTDDSHSYRDWNSGAPYEPEAWGLTIYPGPDYRPGTLVELSDDEIAADGHILARLVRLRDDEHRRVKFTLDEPTRVRIYALGEGDDGEMYDYGWIEERDSHRPVWEMTWRNTDPAGGARKNRLFDGELLLDAGTYEVFFKTDGSHSFNDWNASQPRHPMQWGITVSIAGS